MNNPDTARISALLTSYWRGAVIHAAVKVGLFEALDQGNVTFETLAETTGCVPHLMLSVLHCLERMKLVKAHGDGWKLTEDGKLLTKSSSETLVSSAQMWWCEHLDAWRNLDHTLRTGESYFETLYGKPFFEWLENRDEARQLYHESMREYARIDYVKVPEIINRYKPRRLIDIGGGTGILCEMILELDPEMKAYLLDKPSVIEEAEKVLKRSKHYTRLKFLKGDFFHLPEGDYDAAVLSRVLHDWGDKDCLEILRGVRGLLSRDGHLFIIERAPNTLKEVSLVNLDLAVITRGVERTYHEFYELLSRIRFEIIDSVDLLNGQKVMIARFSGA